MRHSIKMMPKLKVIVSILLMTIGTLCDVYGERSESYRREVEYFLGKNAEWSTIWPRKLNPVHVVVVFTKFKGEASGDSLAPSWANQLFNSTIGSIPHFFSSISFGQYKVTGECLPKRYELPGDQSEFDNMYDYSLAVIQMLDEDPTVDFSRFDNDGNDGVPGSADDDGYVDYMVLIPLSVPYDFIQQNATGVMYLGMKSPYRTSNKNAVGEYITIDKTSGCITAAASKNQAIGSICAEICHAYGAVDLMDLVYVIPETDSAGAGYWDILGRGSLGWGERDGPVGPCAYNRILMNCAGYQNRNLVDLYGVQQNVRMKDVGHPEGKIYRVWVTGSEYFLLEYRSNIGGNYYDRQLPKSGLLIWHIDEKESNSTEETKLCDLECADGRYIDKGYPAGKLPDPIKGRDNLDFWSHDPYYTTNHYGNQGDSTDVFDGVEFKAFGTETNPNSYSQKTGRPTGIEIFNIRKEGDQMVFDCYLSPIPDQVPSEAPLIGLAFQRSRTSSSYLNTIFWEKDVYLVNFGLGHMADALVIINKDSLIVEPLQFLSTYEAQKAVERQLITSDMYLRSSEIVRRYVSPEDFRALVSDFNVRPEDLGNRRSPSWVQKVVRLSDSDIFTVTALDIRQNYPNPFNNLTTISYSLPTAGQTSLEVYNILGQRVMLVDLGFGEAGFHSYRFDAPGLPSGMYLYRLRGLGLSPTKKFTVIK